MVQEKKRNKKVKKKPSAMAQVHNRVNAGVMDGVVYGGMMEESRERFETWYRGYKAKYGSSRDHLIWLTDDIDYARSYGNRVEEVLLDMNKMEPISLDELYNYGYDYIDGPDEEGCQEMLTDGMNCYFFEANNDSSYCVCLWDKSPIVSRRELSREEFEKIEGYEDYDNPGYDIDLNEAAEPEDEEYEIGLEDGGLEPYGHAIDESTDCVKFADHHYDCYFNNAIAFMSLIRKDGNKGRIFVSPPGNLHGNLKAYLIGNKEINPEEYGRPSELKSDEKRTGRFWFGDGFNIISFYSYPDSTKQIYNNCVEALLAIKEKTGEDFNIGEVMVDLWTKSVRNPIIMPVRWFNNGMADAFLPIVRKCEPYEDFDGNFRYRVETAKGNFTADWKGDDVEEEERYYMGENKKTMYITEEQAKHMKILLENEGTNIKKARRYLEAKGYPPEKRQEMLNAIRNDVPNSRLQQCKFLLGVTRLYFDGELNDGNSIFQLNKVLKYIASDAHVNEYDWNLNGENLQTLVDRFSGVAQADLEKAKEYSNKRQLVANENYTIVPINSAEDAAEYGDYTSWCVTHHSEMYDSYTNAGLGRFYFCLRKGFKNEPKVAGENCPLDSYGLSMIAVSVTIEGDVNTITCRWNHDNGGNDNIMSVEQLENIIGRNFYQTFLPYTKDELRKKGIIFPEDVQGMLDAGTAPQYIFRNFGYYRAEQYGIYGCVPVELPMGFPQIDADGDMHYEDVPFKYNFLRSDNKLLSDIWYDYVSAFKEPGVAIVERNEKRNMVDIHGNILFKDWYDNLYYREGRASDGKFIARVTLKTTEQDTTEKKHNLIYVETGELLFNDWYDDIDAYFGNDGLVHVKLNNMENLVDINGKPFLKQWYYHVFHFNDGIAQVGFKANEDVRDTTSKWNFVDKNGMLLSNENFELVWDFKDGFAIVGKSVPNEDAKYTINDRIPIEFVFNAIDRNGNLLLDSWLRDCKYFEHEIREYVEKYIREKGNREEHKIKLQQQTVNESSARGNIIETKEYSFDYKKYIKSLIDFMREQHLRIDPLPSIELNPEEQDGIFVKTGYYSPDEHKVVVFTNQRHPKDVLRTVAHEFVHHMQNLQNPGKDWGSGGDLEEDSKLRSIEGEAFLLGNIIFREWTEKMKKTGELNESKKRKKQVKNDRGKLVPETCDKCGGKVVCQIHGEPVYVCKDCGKYFGTMPCKLNETINIKQALKDLEKRRDPDNIENWDRLDEIEAEIVEPDDVDLSSFNIKKHLNPKFWDDGHLDTRIRLKLLDIADDFFDSLGIDWVEPEDIIITGSIANYNWNKKYSDIDLHILVDYEDVDERVDFVRDFFTLKKNEWNEKHKNLRIFGFPVEVYVQDANEPHASSGVYSIDKDKWLTEPDFDKLRSGKVNKKHIRETVSTYMNKIDCLIDIYKKHKDDEYEMKKVAKDAAEIFDEIKKIRKDDLEKYGREMCDGNIIFKALRRSDYIGKLIKLKDLTYDKINSL